MNIVLIVNRHIKWLTASQHATCGTGAILVHLSPIIVVDVLKYPSAMFVSISNMQ